MSEKTTKIIDWEAIEREYRAGIRSLRDIAEEHGCSNPAILKRAKKYGWTRDLAEKIRAKADALVSAATVSNELALLTEKEIIDGNAAKQAAIRRQHQVRIDRLMGEVDKQASELATDRSDLKDRASILKSLVESTKNLIGLERQAFGIADNADGDKGDERIIKVERVIVRG